MQAPPTVAPEEALDWYFDHYIANAQTEEEETEEEETEKLLPTEKDDKKEDSTSQNASTSSADPQPVITNVISTVYLGCMLDLDYIAHKARNVEYSSRRFKYVRMRLKSPRATAVISAFGNMMCSGTRGLEESRRASRRFARIVQNLGFPVRFINFQIQNLMVTYQLFPLSLERLCVADPRHCSYEPELFPGLFYFSSSKFRALVFTTGTVIFTGSRNLGEIHESFRSLFPLLCRARR